jgi:hypothetical protein
MKREKGEIIDAHVHNEFNREIARTQEVLILRSGKVQVDLYNGENKYWCSFTLGAGNLVFWPSGAMASQCLKQQRCL